MNIDTQNMEEITCPYCGEELADSYDEGEYGDVECDGCGRKFEFTSETTVTYTSEKNCELNKEEHMWVPDYRVGSAGKVREKCQNCEQHRYVTLDKSSTPISTTT